MDKTTKTYGIYEHEMDQIIAKVMMDYDYEPKFILNEDELAETFDIPSKDMSENATLNSIHGNLENGNASRPIAKILQTTPKSPGPEKPFKVYFDKQQMMIIQCNNKKLMACLDTGSPINIVTLELYQHLTSNMTDAHESLKQEIIKYNKPVSIPTLNGQIMAVGRAKLPINIGNGTFQVTFQVIEDCWIDMIIGEGFLDEYAGVINYEDRTLTVKPTSKLRCVKKISLPPFTGQTVQLYAQYVPSDVRFKMPIVINNPLKSISLSQSKAEVVNNNLEIQLENKTNQPITLNEDSEVATSYFATIRDNVLMELSKCLEFNRSHSISELDGVTKPDAEYITAIDKLDLTNCKLNTKNIDILRKKIFEQRGALAIGDEIGCLKSFQYEIKMKPHTVYNKESYKMNAIGKKILREKIDNFVKNEVAQQYMSEYSSPALLVRKPQFKGEKDINKVKFRMVIDLRQMNENAVHLKYSLPVIHETMTELNPTKFKYFSLLDISDAFYQVSLHPDSYQFTTFKTPTIGSYCLTRLPQGYVGAPSIFQAIIENLFPHEIREYLTCYIDDMLLMTETEEKHLEVIEIVLYTLRQNGIKLKIEKCIICPPELNFLGFTLCEQGVKVRVDKCKAITELPRPMTKTQVRSFLGGVGWYRRYIKNFAKEAKPLHEMTKDEHPDKNIPWNNECQKSFDSLKQLLSEAPILRNMNYANETIMRADCSGVALGGTLSQTELDPKTNKTREYVVAYYSRVLQPHEYNYDITSREALAVLSSVKNWATYLRFIHFLIRSDHYNLKYIFKVQKSKQESHRLIRWANYLSGFDFNIQFCSGDSPEIRMTDFLSRYPYEELNEEIGSIARKLSPAELRYLEDQCPDCSTDSSEKVNHTHKEIIPDCDLLNNCIAKVSDPVTFHDDSVKNRSHLNVYAKDFQPGKWPDDHNMFEIDPLLTEDMPNDNNKMGCDEPFEESEETIESDETITHSSDNCELNDDTQNVEDSENYETASEHFENEDNNENNDPERYANDNIDNENEDQTQSNTTSENWAYEDSRQEKINHPIFLHNLTDDLEIPPKPKGKDPKYPSERTSQELHRYFIFRDGLDKYKSRLFSRSKLRDLQMEDQLASEIIHYLQHDKFLDPKNSKKICGLADHFFLNPLTGILAHIESPAVGLTQGEPHLQLYIPDSLVNYVIDYYHSQKHSGLETLIAQIKERYWFHKMPSKIQNFIDNCSICQLSKRIRNPYTPELIPRKMPTQPAEVWYLDHLGPMTYGKDDIKTKHNFKYVLVAVDSYSQYTELILCEGTTAAETADKIYERIFLVHSWPKAIVHDQGTAFVNNTLRLITKHLGIKNYQTCAMNPRSNGVSEARVKVVSVALSKCVNEKKGDWAQYIPVIQFGINSVPTPASGVSPFTLQTGRLPNDPVSLALIEDKTLLRTHLEYLGQVILKTKKWRAIVNQKRKQYNDKMKERHDKDVNLPEEIKVGEFCYLHVPFYSTETKGIRRLNIPWRGPFVITETYCDKRFVRLARVSDFIELPKRIHVNRIKITKLGLNPPKYAIIPGITPDNTDDLTQEDQVVTPEMEQPWDDNKTVTTTNEGNTESVKTAKPLDKRDGKSDQPIDDAHTRIPIKLKFKRQSDGNYAIMNDQTELLEARSYVRLAPRVRTTRQGTEGAQSEKRAINKVLQYKKDSQGNELVKVLCDGDPTGAAFWCAKESIISDNTEALIQNCKKAYYKKIHATDDE
jgi:transposase InsO family protein